jgi:hypothetical protein
MIGRAFSFQCLTLALAATPGCTDESPAQSPAAGEGPEQASRPDAQPPAPNQPTSVAATPAPLFDLTGEPSVDAAESGCVGASFAVELVREPVDIVIVLDNSGSMGNEARGVEATINGDFAAILEESGVDYRVILISEHRERSTQDTAVCITGPLSTLAACPAAAPGLSERFFHYSTSIGSGNSFDVLLETYDGQEQDDFGLAPLGWSQWLRPGAKKVFLEFTDDNANMTSTEFLSSLTALAPEHFGAGPSQHQFVWHSIVGLAERPDAAEPYAPADPVEEEECQGSVFNAGTRYQELSRLTGGLRFPICKFDGYDAVFRRIAGDVAESRALACSFTTPPPPPGQVLNMNEIAVSYRSGAQADAQQLGRVELAERCGADAFTVEAGVIRLCPAACTQITSDPEASVEVLLTCRDTLLR